jgi:catalase
MRIANVCRFAALSAALLVVPAAAIADDTQPEALVDALNGVFGKHAGKRAAHTKGICVKGSFTPKKEAAALTKAPQFAAPVPLTGRFSLGGGNPMASDSQQDNARGMALHFNLADGGTTDLVMISAPVFLAKTPEQFLTLLKTVAPGPDGKQDADKIAAFFKANPESTRQGAWLKARPVPASYASADYFGVHAFTLTNAGGEKHVIKWKVVPAQAEAGLSADDAKTKGKDFYAGELKDRLAKGPANCDLMAILGQPGDPDDDPTVEWPEAERKSVNMGTISIIGLEDDAKCDVGIFDPNNLADGVEAPANDKILPMRSLDYAVSFGRRTTN